MSQTKLFGLPTTVLSVENISWFRGRYSRRGCLTDEGYCILRSAICDDPLFFSCQTLKVKKGILSMLLTHPDGNKVIGTLRRQQHMKEINNILGV